MALLVVLGAAMLGLAVVVWVLNRDTSTDVLAVGLLLSGLATVIVVLPRNGSNGKE
jgi:hypothetical protein